MTSAARRPVHVLYGGAHLFNAEAPAKLGRLARTAMTTYGSDDDAFAAAVGLVEPHAIRELAARVRAKLEREPIEAMCIDFEDGYGPRGDAEEDRDAERAGAELGKLVASGSPRPVVGVRIKAVEPATRARALATLERFVGALVAAGGREAAHGLTVTLPKVSRPEAVETLAGALAAIESAHGLGPRTLGLELMVETPRALYDVEGRLALPALVAASDGRCRAAHLGAYDLTASLGVAATEQSLDHPACDLARTLMTVALAETDVAAVDGATTQLPVPRHKAAAERALEPHEEATNRTDVHRAWKVHAANVARALRSGIYEGWDLHPAQIPARYGALYAFFLAARERMARRLGAFVENATKAMRHGQVFDDAATGQGMLVFFVRGIDCGALGEEDLAPTGLTMAEVRSRSFADIVARRVGAAS